MRSMSAHGAPSHATGKQSPVQPYSRAEAELSGDNHQLPLPRARHRTQGTETVQTADLAGPSRGVNNAFSLGTDPTSPILYGSSDGWALKSTFLKSLTSCHGYD